jgi:hypothetical protein
MRVADDGHATRTYASPEERFAVHLRRLRRLRYKLEGRPAPIGLLDLASWLALWWLWPV